MTDAELSDQIVDAVKTWVDRDAIGNVEAFEHADEFPQAMFDQMCEFGLFGATIAPEYGGLGLDATTYARIIEELSRGWMSLAGIVNTHKIGATMIARFGTRSVRARISVVRSWRSVGSGLRVSKSIGIVSTVGYAGACRCRPTRSSVSGSGSTHRAGTPFQRR